MEAQTRLLRVLQQGEYTTVGGRTPIRTNVRIVAATNKDLRYSIQQGSFREDLFFRLNVVPLRLPPLRERTEDIPDLIRHFFVRGVADGLSLKTLDQAAMERLKRYPWPGNIRELENLARRLAALYPQDVIAESLIETELGFSAPLQTPFAAANAAPQANRSNASQPDGDFATAMEAHIGSLFRSFGEELPPVGLYHRLLRELEAPLISATLATTRGNQIKAAEVLGLNRNTLRKKIRDLDLRTIRPIR
jgi:two-component system nitrogen regulation response regulator GlnG